MNPRIQRTRPASGRRGQLRRIAAVFVWLAVGPLTGAEFGNPQAILRLANPSGLTTDLEGNVVVISDAPTRQHQLLGRYTAQGQPLQTIAVGDFLTTIPSRLATLPTSGAFLQLWSDGLLHLLDAPLTRAATLYKRGETYRHDPTAGEAPLGWVNALVGR